MAHNDGTTVVTYSSLDLASLEIKKQAADLDRDLHEISSMIAQVSDIWEGEAKRAYVDAQRKWNANADAIKSNLEEISKKVAEAAPIYRSGDKRAAANF
ncbi:WXG100 family type VII secretion target [Streptomyces californicus]|uniref:WXG100 family type VII secretion target n=1 Tax=Streptomyces californicus TaxID=67351 RepID=UPI00296F3B49|nr:WXG100 family type VII secretion target [Streptomyces californicus]MDW4916811.1 WXG100 family type VII secretion target [Streptomyces californicus]